ncbi:MAG: prolyl oligopeptidase family serine peptidase [Cyclobacteriaceae bacterium]
MIKIESHFLKSLVFALVMLNVGFANAQSLKELKLIEGLQYEKEIVYKIVGGDTLDMILFTPRLKKYDRAPVILYTHGGGWGGGSKYNITRPAFRATLQTLLENGIVCATIEYRLTRKKISTAYDCVVDCKDAARFLIKHAEKYELDTDRMGVWGGSAGEHLSLMTGLGKNEDFIGDNSLSGYDPVFRCVASYFPLTSFVRPDLLVGSNFEKPQRFVPILGGLKTEKEDLAKGLSPVELLTRDSPPILLLHGDKDKVLPISQSIYMVERAQEVGANVRLITVKNAGHSFNGADIDPTIEKINQIAAEFIIEKLTR